MGFLTTTGRAFLIFLEATGRLMLFTGVAISHCFRPPFYLRLIGRQMIDIGYYSLPVVGLTALFTGMVLALAELYRLRPLPGGGRRRHGRGAVGHA